ncbi:unnamed protein product [Arabidopsis thaliana]|uniref:Uncharacterized protein n=1 Tax=Arabidopsis thaliana TaxID=3702 RepID=A0A5S9XGU4_ARATH|nr:unnamed protein product [Arabidopsis thaliana]
MRFSLNEFHLVTGLPCWIKEDEIPVDFECDWPLSPGKTLIKVDYLIAQLKIGREVIHLFSTKKMRKLRFGDGSDVDAEMQTHDSAGETQTDAYVERETDDSEDETQTLEKDQGLVERFQKLRFQDDEPSAITAILTTPLKNLDTNECLEKKQIFSPFGHKKKSQRR